MSAPVRADRCGWELCKDSAPVAYMCVGVAGSQAAIFACLHFLVLYLVTTTVRKSLLNLHRYTTI